MGTRSLTIVRSQWEKGDDGIENPIEHHGTIYVHWDGYLSGHGRWLADWLDGVVVTNGELGEAKHYNGPGRLCTGMISDMHVDGKNPDLVKEGSICGQEYEYEIFVDYGMGGGTITVIVRDGPVTFFGMGGEDCANEVFRGSVEEYRQFISDAENPQEEEVA